MVEIKEEIIRVVAKIAKKPPEDLSLDTRLAEDLMLKSMSKIELAALLESKFQISISNFEIRKPKKIKDLIELVEVKLK